MLVPLTRGKFTEIDDSDSALVLQYKWYASPTRHSERWYVATRIDGHTTYMHRLIMNAPARDSVDHIDGDGLNNRRSNLRLANCSQQAHNSRPKGKHAAKHSKYKGVSFHSSGLWRAEIELPGRKRIIRYAKTEEEAAKLYDSLALEYFGRFARTNKR